MSNALHVNVGDILVAARIPKHNEKKKFLACYVVEIVERVSIYSDYALNDDENEQRFKVLFFDKSDVHTYKTSEFGKWWEFPKQ
jgi:hypothetical protein